MHRFWMVTAILAILAGVAAAWLAYPPWRAGRTLDSIASAEAAERATGWAWLLVPSAGGEAPRAEALLDDIADHLADAPDDALLDGASRLRAASLWSWDRPGQTLVWRELSLRASSTNIEHQWIAADALSAYPLDAEDASFESLAHALLGSPEESVRRAAFAAACGRAGRDRPAALRALPIQPDDSALLRSLYLVLARCRPVTPREAGPLPSDEDVLEAILMLEVSADPDDAGPILDLAGDGPLAASGALAYVLRHSRDRRAVRELERRAEEGSDTARFALQARSRSVDETQARRVVSDPAETPGRRRLAAWRWDRLPPDLAATIVDLDPAEWNGSVLGAVLLAERRLSRVAAGAQAERWIRSYDDDEKRAGAYLAALLGEHADLLEHAYEIEDIGAVRTAQRHALWALGRPPSDADPLEFAFRTLHTMEGDFRHDTVMCMLIAGRAEALKYVTSSPTTDPLSVRTRAWLIERFVPEWHEELGRPVGGSGRAILLHFGSLDALRLVTWRRLRFDAASRTFRSE